MGLYLFAERAGKTALNQLGVRSCWKETSVGALHYYDARGLGSLPTVVLLHGIGSSAFPFALVLQRLRRHVRRIILAEAPGHGFSATPKEVLTPMALYASMRELLNQVLDEPAIVVGNSLGGAVALSYAMTSPERVRGLMLASPAGASMPQADLDRLLSVFRLRSRADVQSFLSKIYHRVPWFAPLIENDLVQQYSREVIVSFASTVRSEHAFTPEQLASLTMPILLIWGRSDRLMPRPNLEYFRRHLPPHTRIEELEKMGHSPHMDSPHQFADRVVAFAQDTQAERRQAS